MLQFNLNPSVYAQAFVVTISYVHVRNVVNNELIKIGSSTFYLSCRQNISGDFTYCVHIQPYM